MKIGVIELEKPEESLRDMSFPFEPPRSAVSANIRNLEKHLMDCPFCGAKARVEVVGTSSGYKAFCGKCYIPKVIEYWSDFSATYAKRTKQEDYNVPWEISLLGTMKRIVKSWNTRVTP